jgi:hypothetical protein
MRDHKQRHKNVMTLPNNPEKKHHALLISFQLAAQKVAKFIIPNESHFHGLE